ncbi:MAG: hypothetical protein F6K39_38285 [Okeania sp. SIO3B3]|nr:hypothetical protein [Okeania sp. SIO3B3]
MTEEGRRKKEEGRRKKEEGRRKKEEGRRKKEKANNGAILVTKYGSKMLPLLFLIIPKLITKHGSEW